MTSEQILQYITNNEIELLKKLLTEEIYNKSLSADKRTRYKALQKYYKYKAKFKRPVCEAPSKIMFRGEEYLALTDGITAVLTTENYPEVELYDGKFFDIELLFNGFDSGKKFTTDINDVISQAKSSGYKYNKAGLEDGKFVCQFENAFINITYLEKAFSLINDGKPAEVTYCKEFSPICIKTSIGYAVILPMRNVDTENRVVIAAEEIA